MEIVPSAAHACRHQYKKIDTYLSTIEAIYHLYRQLPIADGSNTLPPAPQLTVLSPYDGRFDNLLYLFAFLHAQIKDSMAARGFTIDDPGAKRRKGIRDSKERQKLAKIQHHNADSDEPADE